MMFLLTLVSPRRNNVPVPKFPFHTLTKVCISASYNTVLTNIRHAGQPMHNPSTGGAAIYYDPDSADDFDEDDPDEDLDI